MTKSTVSWPFDGRASLRVDWISTLMESRQDVNLLLASRGGWVLARHAAELRDIAHSRFLPGTTEALETRLAMSAGAPPAIQMLSATTTDSKSVTIEYQVNQVPTQQTRSSSASIARAMASSIRATRWSTRSRWPPRLGIRAERHHRSTRAVSPPPPSALTSSRSPWPRACRPILRSPTCWSSPTRARPPQPPIPSKPRRFAIYTIGIVTHGGIQDPSWKHGPPWEIETAYMMRHEGFDSVIAYNWVLQSGTPGEAIKQSPRLARMILDVASKFPAGDPVDLEFIGHSEGTVVNTYAIVKLESKMTPQLKSGYIEDTLLDPHAANNNVPGQQMSFGGALGGLARDIVTNYQAEAKDPPRLSPRSSMRPRFSSSTRRPRPVRSTTSGARFPSRATDRSCITTT